NTLYLLGDVTCSQVQFHTSNGTRVQGDCTAYDGTKTVFDGASSASNTRLTLGLQGAGGDATSGVQIFCVTIQHYGNDGSGCSVGGDNNVPQLDTWTGWILSNDTIGHSCRTGIGMHSTTTLRNSHVTGNLHLGVSGQTANAGGAAGTMFLNGD